MRRTIIVLVIFIAAMLISIWLLGCKPQKGVRMIELTDYKSGRVVFIAPDFIGAICDLPETGKFPARTRVDCKSTMGGCFLVKESATIVRQMMKLCKQKGHNESKP